MSLPTHVLWCEVDPETYDIREFKLLPGYTNQNISNLFRKNVLEITDRSTVHAIDQLVAETCMLVDRKDGIVYRIDRHTTSKL